MTVELLAPAGSYEALEAAFEAGADAVYLGGQKFGARAYADNLDQEQLIRAIDLAHLKGKQLYLTINTLEAYVKLRDHFGADCLVPVYLEVDDGLRLQRALDRERAQVQPRYKELCRRFLADEEDFSAENLERANIQPIFQNVVLDETVAQVAAYIRDIQNR